MSSKFTRRDFLKIAAGASMLPVLGKLPVQLNQPSLQGKTQPNIIVILLDALSATNLSLYGYPRKTSSAMEKLAGRSIVYHAHHAACNSTAPSTASLFSSTYPWKHRVFNFNGMVNPQVQPINLLKLLPKDYYQAALVQNFYADVLIYQFSEEMDRRLGPDTAGMVGKTIYNHLFPKDALFGAKAYDQVIFDAKENPASLFSALLVKFKREFGMVDAAREMKDLYPEGLPFLKTSDTYFTIDQVMGSAGDMLKTLPAPFFAYVHFMPPHSPYRPGRDFLGTFDDGWAPEQKKFHPLATKRAPEVLNRARQKYDEFIANLDAELGKLLDNLEKSGVLENSYLILTADHGDMFERGQQGHVNSFLFEALTQVPLIISTPGQRERRDIYTTTSNTDLMPTLLNITGGSVPDNIEGRLLPGLGGEDSTDRSIFSVEASNNSAFKPLKKATIAMWRGPYKMIRYSGYKHYNGYELYDLQSDPGEVNDLYGSLPISSELQAEMDASINQADEPYR
ncbi:MAG: sulfatase-like hydrolase/transferase [Chloroflexota bacterium]